MLIASRNSASDKPVPYDAEVEWLEFTGTQWIDTGFYANGGMILETRANQIDGKFVIGSIRGNNGAAADASRNQIGFHRRSQYFNVDGYEFTKLAAYGTNTNALCYPCEVSDTTPHTMYLNTIGTSLIAKVDGQTIYSGTTGTLGQQTNSVKISRSDYSGSVSKGRFFYVKLWDATDILVRDLIPVRFTNEQGVSEGAMYDRTSDKLFRNAGTGAFTIGPDKQ